MGPGGSESSASKLIEAPRLSPDVNKYQYRNDVRMWMRRVRVFAKGGDNRAKGVSNGFGHELYASIDHFYRKVIDSELQDELLALEPEDDDATLTYQEQKALVERMMLLVAKDSSTEAARRLITLGRKVFNCKRTKDETYTAFAERFRGIAQEHLNCFEHKPTEQDKQHTTLILLENSNIPDTIYNNLLSILITKNSNTTNDNPDRVTISMDKIAAISTHLKEASTEIVTSNNPADTVNTTDSQTKATCAIDKIQNIITAVENTVKKRTPDDRIALQFSLEDTIDALKNIRSAQDSTEQNGQLTDNDSQGDKTKLVTNMLTQRIQHDHARKPYIRPGTGAKLSSTCYACGESGHWAKDRECRMWDTNTKEFQRKRKEPDTHRESTAPYKRFNQREQEGKANTGNTAGIDNGRRAFFRN